MDSETQKIYAEGEAVADYVHSKAWIQVKQIVADKILDLQSVLNIKRGSPTDMAQEVYARQLAAEYLMDIIREVEGRAEQHQSNKTLMGDTIIIR